MLSKYGHVSIFETHKKTQKYLKKLYKGSKFQVLNSLTNQKFDLILMADVLEHIKNDKKQIKFLSKKLKKNGKILLTVPAFKYLFTHKDIILGHYRRYNLRQLNTLISGTKLKIIDCGYIFQTALLIRLFEKIFRYDNHKISNSIKNKYINRFLTNYIQLENNIFHYLSYNCGINIPGLTAYIICQK